MINLAPKPPGPRIVIVDYGFGNIFSVRQALRKGGIEAIVSRDKNCLETADALILPGVGAFGDAMRTLSRFDLTSPIKYFALSGRPIMGICLGLQLMMDESCEFGSNEGLGLFTGSVERLMPNNDGSKGFKVPHIGWSAVFPNREKASERSSDNCWGGTLLESLTEAPFFYFIHSFGVKKTEPNFVVGYTNYGNETFCSALQYNNLFAFQFHPEKSGLAGLRIYENFILKVKHMTFQD